MEIENVTVADIPICRRCGFRHRYGEPHGAHSSTGSERGHSKPEVEGSSPSAPAKRDPPKKSRPEKAGESAEEVLARLRSAANERQKRWRERNREAYNAYMREYRKRKK